MLWLIPDSGHTANSYSPSLWERHFLGSLFSFSSVLMISLQGLGGFLCPKPSHAVGSTLLFKDGITQSASCCRFCSHRNWINARRVLQWGCVRPTEDYTVGTSRGFESATFTYLIGGFYPSECGFVVAGNRTNSQLVSSMKRMWVCNKVSWLYRVAVKIKVWVVIDEGEITFWLTFQLGVFVRTVFFDLFAQDFDVTCGGCQRLPRSVLSWQCRHWGSCPVWTNSSPFILICVWQGEG